MKKYLMMAVAGLAIASCSKMDDYATSPAEIVQAKYNQAFLKYVGGKDKIDPNHTWGFGDDVYSNAPAFDFTRAVPTMPDEDDFSEKTDITKPSVITQPTINKNGATVVTGTDNVLANINSGSTVYLEENAVLRLYNEGWPSGAISLQNVNLYMSNGSRLEVPAGLNISGTTNIVNNGGSIVIGSDNNKKNIWFDNLAGIFWNNGSITGIEELGTSNDGGTFYFGSNSSFTASKISLNKVVEFWNEGNITLTSGFSAAEYGHKIYNSGSIITPKIILPKETVLWNEGTITAANSKEIDFSVSNNDVQIYNGTSATLKLETLTFNNNQQLVLNEGTLNVKGKITIPNNSEIVNYNKLTGGSFEMLSGSKFYNVAGGEVTIDGLSKITNDGSGNNKDNVWMNSGKYTTGSFEATGGCQNPAAFNNCHMTVTGKFYMNHSNFVLDGGAAVECGSFEWNSDNYFHMGGKALLKVTGDMLMKNQNSSPNYGFWGDDAEYAVIQANSISKETEGQYRSAYYGNLFIDTNNHFEQGGTDAQPWYYFGSSVKFSFNDNSTSTVKKATKATNFSIDIPADNRGCTPGYKYTPGNPPSTPQNDPNKIRIIAEDLSAGDGTDFDFNDVVLDVTFGNPAKVVLTHAGGTLPLRINGNDANEVHKLFGVWKEDPAELNKQEMVNTGKGPSRPSVDLTEVLNVSINSRSEADSRLKLEVYKKGSWIEMTSPKGEPACKLAVGQDFRVLDEQVSIKGTYPNFIKWVENEKFSSQWW